MTDKPKRRWYRGIPLVLFLATAVLIALSVYALVAFRRHSIEQYQLEALRRRDEWISDTIKDLKAGNTHVHLYSCGNSDVLIERIAGMPEVHCIKFEGAADMTYESLSQLPTFPNLTHVVFHGESSLNDQTIIVLSKCPRLESVTIIQSYVTDAGLEDLAKIPRLRRFGHAGQFSKTALDRLQKQLPNCIIEEVLYY